MNKLFKIALLDAATPWIVGFQDPATPVIIGIIHFYNHLMFFLVAIGVFVCWILYRALVLFTKTETHIKASKFTHSTPLEIVWTITPAFLLLLIAGPSFALLYSIDEVIAPYISLKVIGHQWYWSYEYSDYFNKKTGKTVRFDSYIIAEEDLTFGGLRLLEVDNRVKLPTIVHIRVLVSAADVLHSWAVPSLGVKIDACPGRLNQVSVFLLRSGVFYGQCSEICGVNHGFIPIVVESLDEASYLSWVKSRLQDEKRETSFFSTLKAVVKSLFKSLYSSHAEAQGAESYSKTPPEAATSNGQSDNQSESKDCADQIKLFKQSLKGLDLEPKIRLNCAKYTRASLCAELHTFWVESASYNDPQYVDYYHKDLTCKELADLFEFDPVLFEELDLIELYMYGPKGKPQSNDPASVTSTDSMSPGTAKDVNPGVEVGTVESKE